MADSTAPRVLVINSGSSSLKFRLLSAADGTVEATGIVERVGQEQGTATITAGDQESSFEGPVPDHKEAMAIVQRLFGEVGLSLTDGRIRAVGHRVVQGGARYSDPVLIDEQVRWDIHDLGKLAPLHNYAAVDGIDGAQALLPDVPHVAVFDTAFFAGLPTEASTYAIPADLAAEHKIKKYGFHGTSHEYVSRQAAEVLGVPVEDLNTIVFHLGNGASVSAVKGGRAIDTSMGLTPLQGLVMGTRSGDIDPSIYMYLHSAAGLSIAEIDTMLNKQSGVKGLCGDNDFRTIEERIARGDAAAQLALDVYVHRLRHYLGAYAFALGRLDVVVFTAGVGENSGFVRAAATSGLEHFGLHLDEGRNAPRSKQARIISTDRSPVTIMVVPTNEELAIAREAQKLVG